MNRTAMIISGLLLVALLVVSREGKIKLWPNEIRTSSGAVAVDYTGIELKSYEELNEYLCSAKVYSENRKIDGEDPNSINPYFHFYSWTAGAMYEYYMPAWVPDNFRLTSVVLKDRELEYGYTHKDYKYGSASNTRNVVLSSIRFKWAVREDAEQILDIEIKAKNLIKTEVNENLYYYDFGVTEDDDSPRRSYYWIEDSGYYTMTIPIWVIEEVEAGTMVLNSNKEIILENAKIIELSDITQLMEGDINFDNLVKNLVIKVILED